MRYEIMEGVYNNTDTLYPDKNQKVLGVAIIVLIVAVMVIDGLWQV